MAKFMAKLNFIIHRTPCEYKDLPLGSLFALSPRSPFIRRHGVFDTVVESRGEACLYRSPLRYVTPCDIVYCVSPRYA